MGSTTKDKGDNMGIAGRESVILALETSSRVGSVALALDGRLWDEATFSAPLRHSAEILPTIARLLQRAGRSPDQLGHVYLSVGPGSFTGLRIAVTIAKTLHLAHRTRIVTVDALDVIAANVDDAASGVLFQVAAQESSQIRRLATLLDAKRGQFFVSAYKRAGFEAPPADDAGYAIPAGAGQVWRKTLPDCLMTAAAIGERFANEANPIGLLGDGLLYHQAKFQSPGVRILDSALWSPRAACVYLLGNQKALAGRFSDPLTLVPFYLRGPQVRLKARP
ncbi:MAG: tRNA (adenosine(37)-N6)-threonylcarbamoyltransferase complex dimerization subunit type 1 TsaB [Sedimentisphaerales bacterium]|nr:tRNA (adenosine(37)-N6)-threonylcarbamoyltransferase complex dimerization subunit type 1 TsaB [Sedimentisphaerales bacterium]